MESITRHHRRRRRPSAPLACASALALAAALAGCGPHGPATASADPAPAKAAGIGVAPPARPAERPRAQEAIPAPEAAPGAARVPADAPAGPAMAGEGEWKAVERGTVSLFHPVPGMFRARQTTKLGSQVNGRVQDVLVDVGDRVKAGQELIRLDPAFFDIEVDQKKADVETARVDREDAELNLGRMKNLWDKPDGKEPSIPKKLLDDARTRSSAATAREKQATAQLANAEQRRKESVIRAPYDSVIARRMVDPGEPVTSAPVTELIEVREVKALDLEFSLPQELMQSARPGTRVEFLAEGVEDGTGSGSIDIVFPALDEATRSIRCRLKVNNAEGKFRPGMLVEVRVLESEVRDALVVPEAALARAAGGWQVSVAAGDRAEPKPVKLGLRAGGLAEVKEGVAAGEKVWTPRFAR